jgi:hypothetical protein
MTPPTGALRACLRDFPALTHVSLLRDMAMSDTAKRKDHELEQFLHPATAFNTPMDVVANPSLSTQEKRAILASWASDACAVEAAPDLRRPPSAPLVRFDDIMDALKRLDGGVTEKPAHNKFFDRARRWKDLYRSDYGRRSAFA